MEKAPLCHDVSAIRCLALARALGTDFRETDIAVLKIAYSITIP